ncbi:(2Fe-2S) ferredoxin domain-containing protein [Nostocaceae cyanobacterium CENA357]|uniref:(2Fe-2S) ferredoxin domain-containing protein n=1 Tax=Atlanticothrix silvestris CENA357 TaxID=1725252 RepID=A0A8J7HD21_9CYAN|nr:(2Fe-2S) ferredoxin domain-containing protein [Atlanticothrix silvestris]MBH8550894.1 (2Fe-2S) ferredoxin domain-containing protein [Atlanticothrix silvestris CENA357]
MKKLIKRLKKIIQYMIEQFFPQPELVSVPNPRPVSIPIPTVSPRWQSGLVLVCSQCANEQPTNSHRTGRKSTAAEDLENWLKSRLKFDGLWGEYRVVSTSCLGVCPRGRVTVVLGSDAGDKGLCLIVNPQSDRERLYSYIKQK